MRPLISQLSEAVLSAPAAPRRVYFETHIRPMFRAIDREHMDFRMNLWEYLGPPSSTRLEYEKIHNRLNSSASDTVMPPPEAGGPWPTEWIDLFNRWFADGAPRLDLAVIDPSTLRAVRDPLTGTVDVYVEGTKLSDGHVVWLERHFDPAKLYNPYADNEFDLFQAQYRVLPPAPVHFVAEDFCVVPSPAISVSVYDSAGRHVAPIT